MIFVIIGDYGIKVVFKVLLWLLLTGRTLIIASCSPLGHKGGDWTDPVPYVPIRHDLIECVAPGSSKKLIFTFELQICAPRTNGQIVNRGGSC